ncbi:hypothetical protein [Actinoallomurus rhizosphaericola]|uniref:hypothetical protein n=1 Tax=Actinoallomurus rhizosphaericola TaxID=2952536 RepID=UPI0020909219|nr:hypothetical protein [Actinoallomurus rhizosphaericola]MCO5993971.1 hypothetical protein [Actinoallomurus rhizosphaericola]
MITPLERTKSREGEDRDFSAHTGRPRNRVSISLTGEAMAAAEALAEEHGITEGEAVRRALAVFKFLSDETARGTVFRMQLANGESERLRILFA